MNNDKVIRLLSSHIRAKKNEMSQPKKRTTPPTAEEVRAMSSEALRRNNSELSNADTNEAEQTKCAAMPAHSSDMISPEMMHIPVLPPDFEGNLVNDFFPDLQETVRSRMHDNPIAKLALGSVCAEVLKLKKPHSAFFECGSTVALSVLAMRKTWHPNNVFNHDIALSTNSALVLLALYGFGEAIPRLLYGDRWLNTRKYLGFFPIRPSTIISASKNSNSARHEVQAAWEQMCRDGASFDVSFLTASRFHFVAGPFVGSPDNSFLKYAFYGSGRNLYVLIDGSKILRNAALLREWESESCFWPFGSSLTDAMLSYYVSQLFPQQPENDRERLMEAITNASDRNPQSFIHFPSVFVPSNRGKPGEEIQPHGDMMEEITAVPSWPECVERIISKGGTVTICISQPDEPSNDFQCYQRELKQIGGTENASDSFEPFLTGVIQQANRSFRKLKSPLYLEKSEPTAVCVHPGNRTLSDKGSIEGCVKVPVWRCVYGIRASRHTRHASPALAYK